MPVAVVVTAILASAGSATAATLITGANIKDGSIYARDLATGSVLAAEIASNAVTASEIATNAVGSGEIATNAVGTSEAAKVPAAEVYGPGSTDSGVSTDVTWQSENFDTGSLYDPLGSGAFSITTPGIYDVKSTVCFPADGAGTRAVSLLKGGVTFQSVSETAPSATQPTCLILQDLMLAGAGEQIKIVAYQNSASTLALDTASSNFSIHWVGKQS